MADTSSEGSYRLEKRQKSSTVIERRVRRLLNRHTEASDREAWKILSAVNPDKRSAEWYFLLGCLRYRMGHLTDALSHFNYACELSKGKIPEYERFRDELTEATRLTSETLARFGEVEDVPPGCVTNGGKRDVFFGFVGEVCVEGCCECSCQCCAEGGCEACCSNCDCDCG